MNNTVLRVLSAVMALILVFSLGACGNDDSGSQSSSSSSSSEVSSEVSSAVSSESTPESAPESSPESSESSAAASGTYATVSEFLEDNRSTVSAAIESMAGDQDLMEISLDSTDDSLIYKFVFTDSAMEGVDEKALIDALQEGVDAEDFTTTFEDIAASVKSLVPLDAVKVEVIYAKADGTELVHKTYTSK